MTTTTADVTARERIRNYDAHHQPTSTLTGPDKRVLQVMATNLPAYGGTVPKLREARTVADVAAEIAAYVETVQQVMTNLHDELDQLRALEADVEAARRLLGVFVPQPAPAYDDLEDGIGGE